MVKHAAVALSTLLLSLGTLAHGEILLLDFTSPDCGPCQQMIPTVRSLEQAGYPIRKIDVTQERDLASRFGVTQWPCFVMLADGREVARVVGATSRDRLEQLFRQAERQSDSLPADGVSIRSQSPDPTLPSESWTGVQAPAARPVVQGQSAFSDPPRSPLAAPGGPVEGLSASDLICASVRLRVEDSTGQSYGTGTIIDTRSGEALVITCGHLFRESKGEGPVTVELFAATENGVRVVGQVPGQVVSYNLERDIGLVSIRPSGSVRVAPVAPADAVVDRGDRVTSVGCNHGQDPSAVATHVTAINRYQGSPNVEASGAPVEGRSGGGLFNAQGQLVGVCFAADYEGNEGLYVAVESIHDELDRLGLGEIYQASLDGQRPANADALAAPIATAAPPVVRGQEPTQPVMPLADARAIRPVNLQSPDTRPVAGIAASPDLNPVEQAAFEEIMGRAVTAEVVCIVRPTEPGGKSEVITLNGVSPQFVRALLDARNAVVPDTASRQNAWPVNRTR
jgi:thiol-disulfide isomerase/thioredoxin